MAERAEMNRLQKRAIDKSPPDTGKELHQGVIEWEKSDTDAEAYSTFERCDNGATFSRIVTAAAQFSEYWVFLSQTLQPLPSFLKVKNLHPSSRRIDFSSTFYL